MRRRKRVVTAIDRPAPWTAPVGHARRGPSTNDGGARRRAEIEGGGAEVRYSDPEPEPAVDLSVELGRGLVLRNPILAASGSMGYGVELQEATEIDRLGGLSTRGTTLRPRAGNPPPRMIESPAGLLNGIGLHNPGIEAVIERYAGQWAGWRIPVIVNLAADSTADFVELARRLDGVPGVAGIELNLSCPNGARGGTLFGLEAEAAGALTAAVRQISDLPLIVKLSPAAPDPRSIARAIAEGGADALSAVNTMPGLALNHERSGPLLGSTYGGLSGPALRPIALRVVYEISRAVTIPVIAMGGVASLDDVLDFLAVGAVAVAVGTAAISDPALPGRLADELADECRRRRLTSGRSLVGTALPRRPTGPAARGAEYRP